LILELRRAQVSERGVQPASAVDGIDEERKIGCYVLEGFVTAQIFWLKTRARWREGLAVDEPVPSADAGSNSEVILTLPDNNRDPELTQVLRDAQQKYFAGKRQRQPPAASDA